MAKVTGTKGNVVDFEIEGIADTMRKLQKKGVQITNGVEVGLVRATNFVQNEIKESIAGNREQTRSVDTGKFINSVDFKKSGNLEFTIFSDVKYAKFLEYGTSRIPARKHFRATMNKNSKKIKSIIEEEI